MAMKRFPKLEAAFSKEVLAELHIALAEVGKITPHYDEDYQSWVFSHPAYPSVEAIGDSAQECAARYKGWLAEFIQHRMQGRIHPTDEKTTSGRGGWRPGAGRPKGTTKTQTRTIRVPVEIAAWLKADPVHMDQVRRLMDQPKKKRA